MRTISEGISLAFLMLRSLGCLNTIMLEVNVMFDLVEVKQELEKMAKRLADIRGSL
ncbi:hypothetical protein GCM10008982_12010 [Anoxybacillus voinovskiensis]|nr:hypothetical protein GCM10008982_12010 [Anoxybacillus voinovskiensis]